MRNAFRDKFIIFIVFAFYYLLIEYMTFKWVGLSILPQSFIVDLLFIVCFGLGVFIFKSNKKSFWYITILLAYVLVIYMVNATLYSVYFELFNLGQISLIGEANSVFSLEFISPLSIILAGMIIFIYVLTAKFLLKKVINQKIVVEKYHSKIFAFLLAAGLFVTTFFISDIYGIEKYKETEDVTIFKRASFEEFGILGFYYKEIDHFLTPEPDSPPIDDELNVPYLPSLGSEYFGLLEGANVITIMVESFEKFAVNEYLTPNLYRLVEEGLFFPNNYSENRTNYSESIGIIGHYPSLGFSPDNYIYDFSETSLPKILGDNYSYRTAYFHDNVGSFYGRNNLLGPMGFKNVYFHDDLFPDKELWTWNGDYTLDSFTWKKIMEAEDFNEEPFYYFWSTLSMHGPYDNGPINKELFSEYGYFDLIDQYYESGDWTYPIENIEEEDLFRLRHYEAAVMDFDKALGVLFDELERNDILNDTIIVVYGDHSVYYHNLQEKIQGKDNPEYYDMDMYQSFLGIYNPLLTDEYLKTHESNIIDKFTSPQVIVPTIYDLLGIEYNQNLILAEAVFSEKMEVFYSNKLTSFFTDKVFSNDGFEIIYYKEDVSGEYEEAFYQVAEEHRNRIEMINYWYSETKVER